MGKTFTATAAMIAVQDGLLDLDEPITTYVLDFAEVSFKEHKYGLEAPSHRS